MHTHSVLVQPPMHHQSSIDDATFFGVENIHGMIGSKHDSIQPPTFFITIASDVSSVRLTKRYNHGLSENSKIITIIFENLKI